jgi:hypothetical protein
VTKERILKYGVTDWLTDELTPWNRVHPEKSSASQEIPRTLCNPVDYRIHKSPPSVAILSQIDPVRATIPLLEDPF